MICALHALNMEVEDVEAVTIVAGTAVCEKCLTMFSAAVGDSPPRRTPEMLMGDVIVEARTGDWP